ncbi:hypothetical protein [Leptobacterium sp. I13]|uniref:hypothetical protein n=1 Tax=Leptobacterium meishanense TaxID=3128904 RepID=UPI0030EE4343
MSESNNLSVEIKHLLLTIIGNDGNIDDLNKIGYDYLKIKSLIKNEIEIGNAQFENDELKLTEKGDELKKELGKQLNYDGFEEIVLPKISSKIDELIANNKIFIPSEDELDF